MSSNRKPPQKSEAPQEPFKRAVAGCLRAMARAPELEVAYAADRPALTGAGEGAKARLPEPARKLTPQEAAIVRGSPVWTRASSMPNLRAVSSMQHFSTNFQARWIPAARTVSFTHACSRDRSSADLLSLQLESEFAETSASSTAISRSPRRTPVSTKTVVQSN